MWVFSCCFVLFLALSYFLALQDDSSLSCIFTASVLDSVISPKNLCSFYRRMVSETKIWVLGSVVFLKFWAVHCIALLVTQHIRHAAIIDRLCVALTGQRIHIKIQKTTILQIVPSTGERTAPAFESLNYFAETHFHDTPQKLMYVYQLCMALMKKSQLSNISLHQRILQGSIFLGNSYCLAPVVVTALSSVEAVKVECLGSRAIQLYFKYQLLPLLPLRTFFCASVSLSIWWGQ